MCLSVVFVVASPDDCPLREQKIILSKSLRKNARITRDNSCQTELTLPPNLPKEVEDALRPYFTYTHNQQQPSLEFCDSPQLDSNDSMSKYAAHNDGHPFTIRQLIFHVLSPYSKQLILIMKLEMHHYIKNCFLLLLKPLKTLNMKEMLIWIVRHRGHPTWYAYI